MSRIDPHAPQRRLRFGDYEPTRQPQTPAKRPLNRQISPKNRHIRRTNQYELCKHFAGLYAFRTIRRTGRGVTPVVSQNKKPLFVKLLRRCAIRTALIALLCAVSACPCLGSVPNALWIPPTGKYRRGDCPGVLSSIAVFAVIAALVRVDLPSVALRSVVRPAEFVLLSRRP